ncbi:nuclear transport factor 2 family protein [Spongiimicrobium salis]|uniref:nuclear transport factor 2 family protein n=1 Tax=Spongiimicrobium salis TaxID=1667022 RepID=UPI00374DBC95
MKQEMSIKVLVSTWFDKWKQGDFLGLPIAENFKHTSPFGTIEGKKAYTDIVEANKDKFLGYVFEIHDALYEPQKACVRYTARQGTDFSLDVSEWYYAKNNLIQEIVAHYHIGDIHEERKIEHYNGKSTP